MRPYSHCIARAGFIVVLCSTRLASGLPQAEVTSPALAGSSHERRISLLETIRASEYQVSRAKAAAPEGIPADLQAPNRSQGFRTWFAPSGIRIVRREAEGSADFVVGLDLTSVARGAREVRTPRVAPEAKGARVEYRRTRGIVEWYENGPRGLKQGFTLPADPVPDVSAIQPLRIEFEVSRNVATELPGAGRARLTARGGGPAVLEVSELLVHDARGRVLESRLEIRERAGADVLAIVIDDRSAAYPVIVDPLLTSPGWSASVGGDDSALGIAVETAGDVNGDGHSDLVVGAGRFDAGLADQGQVFLFLGSASGLASVPAWTKSGAQAGKLFGLAVATAGDADGDGFSDVIVGAPGSDSGSPDEGRAFLYRGSAAGLAASPSWSAESDESFAELGAAVASLGDLDRDGRSDLIVGAPAKDGGKGRVIVFLGAAAGPSATAFQVIDGIEPDARFGEVVAGAGDVDGDGDGEILVGAPLLDAGALDGGGAFGYRAIGGALELVWTVHHAKPGARFAGSGATAGDVDGDGYADVVLGARHHATTLAGEGAVFVHRGSASGLAALASWRADGGQAGANLGTSVHTAGDVDGDGYADVVAGAPFFTDTLPYQGKAFVWLGGSAGLPPAPDWSVTGTQAAAWLGARVAPAGDVDGDGCCDVAAVAPNAPAGSDAVVLVFHGSADGPKTTPAWTMQGTQGGEALGCSVAAAGDVDGDGHDDVLVGASGFDAGAPDVGRAYLFRGCAGGIETSPFWTGEGDQAGARFGAAVAGIGDVDGDGCADVAIGSPGQSTLAPGEGRISLYRGAPGGLVAAPWSADGGAQSAGLGAVLATAGDVDGDGYADLLAGAPTHGGLGAGRAVVFTGSPSGLAATPSWETVGSAATTALGAALAGALDVNADGYGDVLVGAPGHDAAAPDAGRVLLFLGSPGGLASAASWSLDGTLAGERLGSAVAAASDLDGDRRGDAAFGAPGFDAGLGPNGRVTVARGSSSGAPLAIAKTIDGSPSAGIGHLVAGAGDLDGDGFADLALAVSAAAPGLRVFYGSPAGVENVPDWTMTAADGSAATALAGVGDADGDGFADLVAGASGAQSGGSVRCFHGGGGPGIARKPRQRAAGGGGPIALRGVAGGDGFRVLLAARSPFGRGVARLEWEPMRADGGLAEPLVVSAPAEVGATLPDFAVDASGLAPGAWSWRARLRYAPASLPYLPAGRWMRRSATAAGELAVRLRASLADLAIDDPTPLVLAHSLGAPDPAPASRTITNAGAPGSLLHWRLAPETTPPWLAVLPAEGSLVAGAASPLAITCDPGAAAVGTNTATLRFENTADPGDRVELPVVLVIAIPLPDLTLAPATPVDVTWTIGTPTPPSIPLVVTNTGDDGSTLKWAVTEAPAASFVACSPDHGTVANGSGPAQSIVSLQFDLAGIGPGDHETVLTFAAVDDPADSVAIPVRLHAVAPPADLAIVPADDILHSWTIGDPPPPPVQLVLSNVPSFGAALDWEVTESPPAAWLAQSPSAGAGLPGGAVATVAITVDPNGLTEGTHRTTLSFRNLSDGADHVDLEVTLVVVKPSPAICLDDASPISFDFVLGGTPPGPALRTVSNCGPPQSKLDWFVEILPPKPWLRLETAGGSDLASGQGTTVGIALAIAGLDIEPGHHSTLLRFTALDSPSPPIDVPVLLEIDAPPPDLALTISGPLVIGHVVGDPPPQPFEIGVLNLTAPHSKLPWTAMTVPPATWLAANPAAGIVATPDPQFAIVGFAPDGLSDGEYSTTLRFQNLENDADHAEIPVTLAVGNVTFVPGDRLVGAAFFEGEVSEAWFDAVKGTKLRLKLHAPTGGLSNLVTVLGPDGLAIESFVIAAPEQATAKPVKKTVPLAASGRHTLRVQALAGGPGNYRIDTDRKLPKKAKKQVLVVGPLPPGGGEVASLLALAGATLDLKVVPKPAMDPPLGVSLADPSGSPFDLDAFSQALEGGGIHVANVPLAVSGAYAISLFGPVGSGQKVKLQITPHQPKKGDAIVVLP